MKHATPSHPATTICIGVLLAMSLMAAGCRSADRPPAEPTDPVVQGEEVHDLAGNPHPDVRPVPHIKTTPGPKPLTPSKMQSKAQPNPQPETKPHTAPADDTTDHNEATTQPGPTTHKATRTVELTMETPSPAWQLSFREAKLVDNELWVLWQLKTGDDMFAAAVITPRTATATLKAPANTPVRHFVVGKTFNWQDPEVEATYVKSEADIGKKWGAQPAVERLPGKGSSD